MKIQTSFSSDVLHYASRFRLLLTLDSAQRSNAPDHLWKVVALYTVLVFHSLEVITSEEYED